MKRFSILSLSLLVVLAPGCEKAPPPPAEPQQPVAQPTPPPPPAKSDPACVGPVTTGTPEKIVVGDETWELNGSTLSLKSALKDGQLVVGAVTDIKEDTEENKENLKLLVAWFKKHKANLIVVAGDTGENQGQVEGALDVLAAAKIPVLNIVGNREGKADYRKAMVALKAKHGNVFDLDVIRRVDTPVADIVSMPGYFNRAYLHNDDGCLYYPADIEALGGILKACDSPVVLVSHGPPKQEGVEALDRTAEGENRGDPGLAKAMAEHKVPYGIFGNFHEAGGRATDLSGKTRLEENKLHPALYMNPGPADGVRWIMNDGGESTGMGGLLTIKKDGAAYVIERLHQKPGPAKGKKAKGK
ncbi:MAG: hypothetical protein HY903_05310 [Deltaproteobacteria bacterium]|nr:hypothetical protein [Deltaproteobacteria bacterium]